MFRRPRRRHVNAGCCFINCLMARRFVALSRGCVLGFWHTGRSTRGSAGTINAQCARAAQQHNLTWACAHRTPMIMLHNAAQTQPSHVGVALHRATAPPAPAPHRTVRRCGTPQRRIATGARAATHGNGPRGGSCFTKGLTGPCGLLSGATVLLGATLGPREAVWGAQKTVNVKRPFLG
jgi:hypothetical protein